MAELVDYNAVGREPKSPTEPADDKKTEQTVSMVETLLKRANRATKGMRDTWPRNYRFVVSGDQWSIRRPRWRFSEVINYAWSHIMNEVGIQTDSRPKFDFAAKDVSDFQFSTVMNQINDALWEKPANLGYGWMQKVATAIFKSKLYHVVHAEVCWNPKLEGGLGDVELKILDPYGCFWDPKATNLFDARWFIYIEPTPTEQLKMEYPEFKDKIKPDVNTFDRNPTKIDDHDIDRYFTSIGATMNQNFRNDRSSDQYGGEDMTAKIRVWIRDESTVEEIVEKENGEQEKIVKKVYPKGRYIEIAGKNVLKDEENPYDDGLFPIARLVNYDYGEYAGDPEITHIMGPQKVVNYVYSHILDEYKRGSNPQKIVTDDAQDIIPKLTDEPGLAIPVPRQDAIRFEPGVGVSPSSFNVLDMSTSAFDRVSGEYETSRGNPDPSVTSGEMFAGVVEASQTRPRLKNRSVDDFLSQVGFLSCSRVLQYYTAPRSFRITGEDGFPQFVEIYVEKKDSGFQVNTQTVGANQPSVNAKSVYNVKGIPDLKVVSGSNLPYSKSIKHKTARELFQAGAITLESYLDAIDWPNAKEEAKKVKEEQQAAAQAASPQ